MKASERLQLVLEELQMSTSALAKYIKLPRADRLYHVQKGRNNISDDLAHKLVAKLPNLSYDWLRFGLGKMWIDQASVINRVLKVRDHYDWSTQEFISKTKLNQDQEDELNDCIKTNKSPSVELIDHILRIMPEVNPDYIKSGTGDMISSSGGVEDYQQKIKSLQVEKKHLEDKVRLYEIAIREKDRVIELLTEKNKNK